MAVREIPVVYKKSRDLLLRLKKEGPYSVKLTKPVTMKDVENAILGDEALIEEIKNKIDDNKLKIIEDIEKKYLEIKDTIEWKELCGAYKKLKEYDRLCRLWTKEECYDVEAYKEMREILEKVFISKYEKIIFNNKYNEFYVERDEVKYSKDSYYIDNIKDIKEDIERLKEYCLQHPNEIRGNKKRR